MTTTEQISPSSVRNRGFTMIELMVVITMLAILLSLAAPSFVAMLKNSEASTISNEFVMGAAYARSEAITRNKCVTMCVADDISAANPACAAAATREWNTGWIIFSNPKCDSDATDDTAELLKAYLGKPAGPSLQPPGAAMASLRFDSRGRSSVAAPQVFNVSPPGEAALKMVCVDTTGRARAGNAGSISCDGSNQN